VAFANIGSTEGQIGQFSTSDTVSAAVASLGANRVGIVLINRVHATTSAVSGVTWDGVAMTQAIAEDTDNIRRSAIYYLVGCAHNGTYNVVVTYSGDAASHTAHITVAWADATGAISIDDTSSAQGTTQNPTITSTQAGANELVVSGSFSAANDLGSPSVTDCTLLQNWDSGGNCMVAAYSQPASSGNATHQHNYGASDVYAITSASFKEAGGTASAVPVIMNSYRQRRN
jgi:hypothetical protein